MTWDDICYSRSWECELCVAAFAPPSDKCGPQGHKIPAQIQPRIRSDECAICRATCGHSRSKISYLCGPLQHRNARTPETDSIDTETHHCTDGQEQHPCDEARNYWETRREIVHGIARRTLVDPTHDAQQFCQYLTERRRTTLKILGQQSEMTVDDTWLQTGEMRSLWKGTTEFWTRDLPQDDTWEPNRHHSNLIPVVRNHMTRTAVAMPPSFVNTVAQAERDRRDSNFVRSCHNTEDAKEKGRRVVLGFARIIQRVQHPPPRLLQFPRHLKMLLLKQQTQAVNDRNSSEGMSSPSGQAPCQLCGAIISNKGEITRTTKAIQYATDDASLQPDSGRTRTDLDLVQDEIDEDKRLLEEAHPEVQAALSKVAEGACRVGEAIEEMAKVKSLMETNLGVSRSMKTSQKRRLLESRKETCGKDGMRPSFRKSDSRAAKTSQSSVSISVR